MGRPTQSHPDILTYNAMKKITQRNYNKKNIEMNSGCENILRAAFVFATVLIATTNRGEAGIKKYLKTE